MEFDTPITETFLASNVELPRIGQSPASFGGRTFHYGVEAPDRAGVYVLIFEYQNRLHPLYVGHGRSIRAAIGDVLSNHDALKRLAHGFYWTPVASEADGRRVAEHLIMALQPHFNAADAVARGQDAASPRREMPACRMAPDPIGEDGRTTARQMRSWPPCGLRRPYRAPAKPAIRSKRLGGLFRPM